MQGAQRMATLIDSATNSLVLLSRASPPCAARAMSENVFITSGAACRRLRTTPFMLPIRANQSSTIALLLVLDVIAEPRSRYLLAEQSAGCGETHRAQGGARRVERPYGIMETRCQPSSRAS